MHSTNGKHIIDKQMRVEKDPKILDMNKSTLSLSLFGLVFLPPEILFDISGTQSRGKSTCLPLGKLLCNAPME
jgi:hypothetical protein